jgi:hypothetical protein
MQFVLLPFKNLPVLSLVAKGYFEPAPVVCITIAAALE